MSVWACFKNGNIISENVLNMKLKENSSGGRLEVKMGIISYERCYTGGGKEGGKLKRRNSFEKEISGGA
jgi:hypothetical protein